MQKLLADYPQLLAGDQINSDHPRRWLLIRREMTVPDSEALVGRWSVDHLFLDQEGIPTLIEVKRSTDNRIRREVVGQMLDYAANATSHWSVERIQSEFEYQCNAKGQDPEEQLLEFLEEDIDSEAFWQNVKTNLQAGRLRLVFVADTIPTELRRVIEFLNSQMNPAEVLALEVKQYIGEGLQTMVPRVVGQTVAAQQKRSPASSSDTPYATEESFFSDLAENVPVEVVAFARELLEWSKERNTGIYWGKGSFIPFYRLNGKSHHFINARTSGKLEFVFDSMKAPFDTPEAKRELMAGLEPLARLPIEQFGSRRPKIDMAEFLDEKIKKRFYEVFATFIEGITR